jgi:hypothetical protein
MRSLFAVGIALAAVSAIAASTGQVGQVTQPGMTVHISHGAGVGSVPVDRAEMYVGRGPFALVAPSNTPAVAQPELVFGLRAWKEGDQARVVVYAVLTDKRAPNGRTETPISTFLIAPKRSMEVKEAQAWGAPGLVVSADVR